MLSIKSTLAAVVRLQVPSRRLRCATKIPPSGGVSGAGKYRFLPSLPGNRNLPEKLKWLLRQVSAIPNRSSSRRILPLFLYRYAAIRATGQAVFGADSLLFSPRCIGDTVLLGGTCVPAELEINPEMRLYYINSINIHCRFPRMGIFLGGLGSFWA